MGSHDEKYYVHSEECWGGTRVWFVFERLSRGWKRASKSFKTEKKAQVLCCRMNVDYERYRAHMSDRPFAPPPD